MKHASNFYFIPLSSVFRTGHSSTFHGSYTITDIIPHGACLEAVPKEKANILMQLQIMPKYAHASFLIAESKCPERGWKEPALIKSKRDK